MKFNLKSYQVLKVKNYLKNYSFVFFYNSAKLKSKKWLTIEQNLKTLKLNYYKVLNGATIKTFKKSSFKNFNKTICGVILFIVPKFKLSQITIKKLEKHLKPLFIILNIKLNNKVYSLTQIKNIKFFDYKKNMFFLYKSLDRDLKIVNKLTNNKKRIEIM